MSCDINTLNHAQRLKTYYDLSPVAQNLIDLIYPNPHDYLEDYQHPLEPYIIELDKNMGSETTIRALASNIGISFERDLNFRADELFVDRLVEFILHYPQNRLIQNEERSSFPSTFDIITMDYTDFKKVAHRFKIPEDQDSYKNRLMVFTELYQKVTSGSLSKH